MAIYDDTTPRGISAFSADGRGNFARSYAGPETGGQIVRQEWGADFDEQARVGADFDDLARRSAAAHRHNEALARDSISAAMKQSLRNGGALPQNAVDMLSRNLGLDGKNRAVFRAGYLSNGDFALDIAERGQNGAVNMVTRKLSPREQYDAILASPGVWGDEGAAAVQNLYGRLRNTLGRGELPAPSVYGQNLQTYRRGVRAREAQAEDAQLAKFVQSAALDILKSKDVRDPAQALRVELVKNDKFRERLMQGKPVLDEKGNQKMQTDDKGNEIPMFEPATEEEMRKSLDGIVNAALKNQPGGGGQDAFDRRIKAVNDLLDRLYPAAPPPDPRETEIRNRQMDAAVEDARRADVMRRPQRLVHYRDADGTLKTGNGYVVDGRVYGPDGVEIPGARLMNARYDADAGETRYEDAALPPAAEIVGGETPSPGAARTTPSSDVARIRAEMARRGIDPATGRRPQNDDKHRTSENYDTRLTPEEETQYQEWRQTLPTPLQYEGDYDLRGYWKDPGTQKSGITDGQHFTDKYKKPNHETFSTESKYAVGGDAKKAGRWEDGRFIPASATSKPLNSTTSASTHTVANGETLEDIAREYETNVAELMELNGMDGADALNPGDVLRVPPDRDDTGEPADYRENLLAGERRRRQIIAAERRAAEAPPKDETPETPLMQTRLVDLPGALARRVERGLGRQMDRLAAAEQARNEGTDRNIRAAGRAVRDVGERIANATPTEIVERWSKLAAKMKSAVAAGATSSADAAKAFAGRIQSNLAEMDRQGAEGNTAADEERNRFFAVRDGRNEESPNEPESQESSQTKGSSPLPPSSIPERYISARKPTDAELSGGDTISPRRRSVDEWVRGSLDVLRKADGRESRMAAEVKDAITAISALAARGKDAALAVVRRMMEEDGVDAGAVTPGSRTGDEVWNRILELSPRLRRGAGGGRRRVYDNTIRAR